LNNVISRIYDRKLSNVKMIADALYVAVAVAVNLISTHSLASVGVSSIASVLLTGRFVGLSQQLFPKIKMEPFFNQ
ncbi:MAG: hypothetical protein HFF18_10230, partial [Oscillospiraceae bacterium]|nr:hypothetical protein [Oscillospiraceae bacterium]